MVDIGIISAFHLFQLLSCLIFLACVQTVNAETICQGRGNHLIPTNISCIYSKFKTINCVWSLVDEHDCNNCYYSLNTEENVHITSYYLISPNQFCAREKPLYVHCRCLKCGSTMCSWQHMATHVYESISIDVTLSNSITYEKLVTCSKYYDLLDILELPSVKNSATMKEYHIQESLRVDLLCSLYSIEKDDDIIQSSEAFEFQSYIHFPIRLAVVVVLMLLFSGIIIHLLILGLEQTNQPKRPESPWPSNTTGRKILLTDQAYCDFVQRLYHDDELPPYWALQLLNRKYENDPEKFKNMYEHICKIIKGKVDKYAIVWPAKKCDKIVFVLETKKMTVIPNTIPGDYELILDNGDIILENESRMVMEKEKEILGTMTIEEHNRLKMLQECLPNYARVLMKKHRNITAILPTVVKSVDFGNSGRHKLNKIVCVSIYVEKKISGLIPLNAEPIEVNVKDFPTDVLQGAIHSFGKGPKDHHGHLKIGLAIHAEVKSAEGHILGGTLGCFVKHRTFDLCCVTSAHVVLSNQELQQLKLLGKQYYENHTVKPVYQPIGPTSDPFGRIAVVALAEGCAKFHGYEVALIKILRRQPISGCFPQTASIENPLFIFNSGNITDANLLQPLIEVFKFGMTTGSTTGSLGISVASVRLNEDILIHNQLVILPQNNQAFAAPGDSGSAVFIGRSRPGREAVIGLVTGGLDNGRVFVTPIHDVLAAVDCPPYLYRFETSNNDSGLSLSMSQHAEHQDDMECS